MSGINYKDPPVEVIPSPIAIDYEIKVIQDKLASIAWLQKIFGRGHLQPQPPQQKPAQQAKGGNQREQLVPEVYYNRSPYDARPNDNLRAYCFFFPRDPMRFADYKGLDIEQPVQQPISIYFWANMQKVDAAKNYDFSDELRRDVFTVLRRCGNLWLEEVYTQWDQVFRPFTITETFKQYVKPPYTAFRFDGVLRFDYAKIC